MGSFLSNTFFKSFSSIVPRIKQSLVAQLILVIQYKKVWRKKLLNSKQRYRYNCWYTEGNIEICCTHQTAFWSFNFLDKRNYYTVPEIIQLYRYQSIGQIPFNNY